MLLEGAITFWFQWGGLVLVGCSGLVFLCSLSETRVGKAWCPRGAPGVATGFLVFYVQSGVPSVPCSKWGWGFPFLSPVQISSSSVSGRPDPNSSVAQRSHRGCTRDQNRASWGVPWVRKGHTAVFKTCTGVAPWTKIEYPRVFQGAPRTITEYPGVFRGCTRDHSKVYRGAPRVFQGAPGLH